MMPDCETSLWGLFLSSFISATLFPGGSEAVLYAVIRVYPEQTVPALLLATLGNTLGGMSTYFLARLIPAKGDGPASKSLAMLRRYGSGSLVLAWTPIFGDALCAAAGWLRLNWLSCLIWMALGKAGRYLLIAAGA